MSGMMIKTIVPALDGTETAETKERYEKDMRIAAFMECCDLSVEQAIYWADCEDLIHRFDSSIYDFEDDIGLLFDERQDKNELLAKIDKATAELYAALRELRSHENYYYACRGFWKRNCGAICSKIEQWRAGSIKYINEVLFWKE